MAENSAIEWTDHTFNPWWGCVRVSPGCVNCYAETFDKRVNGKEKAHWGVKAPRRFFGDKHWNEPLRWNAAAAKAGTRARVFCASMADVFEDRPELVEHRARLFLLIQNTPNLDWLLLTKRPENMVRLAPEEWADGWPANVWAGTTVEDQTRANERIPHLLAVPAAVRFLSCEPLLGPVDLTAVTQEVAPGYFGDCLRWYHRGYSHVQQGVAYPTIHWVIAGGESGHSARPMHPEWATALRDQCEAAGVAFLFKQWGEYKPSPLGPRVQSGPYLARDGRMVDSWEEGARHMMRLGKHNAGRLLDGVQHDGFPAPAAP